MHNYDTIYSSGLRLFLSLISYALLFTLVNSDLMALHISTFTYVIGKWVDVLDKIHQRRHGNILELISVGLGIILASSSIILIATNPAGACSIALIYTHLSLTSLFIIVDFWSFGVVLKKFNNNCTKHEKSS